jgi:short-subunit dehydrogenase
MSQFKNKVIVITGASEGIGRALCLALAPQKPKLALAARIGARLNELKMQVEKLGGQALVVPTDVTQEESCRELINATIKEWQAIDVLVNNAGGTMWTRFDKITDMSIFERLMRLNYLGTVYCTYYALPHLKKNKGLIVGVSSAAGITGVPERTAYAATKHAMFGFFDSLRIELDGTGVGVTMVAPDFVVSEIHRRALGFDGKPLGTSPMQESKTMSAATCASIIVRGMEKRDRLNLTSKRVKLIRLLRIFAPKLIDAIAKKGIRDGK